MVRSYGLTRSIAHDQEPGRRELCGGKARTMDPTESSAPHGEAGAILSEEGATLSVGASVNCDDRHGANNQGEAGVICASGHNDSTSRWLRSCTSQQVRLMVMRQRRCWYEAVAVLLRGRCDLVARKVRSGNQEGAISEPGRYIQDRAGTTQSTSS